jgi:CRISPR/Cas system-associated exonuclease Cas4 (RecB family)
VLNNGPKVTSLKTDEANIFIHKYRSKDAEREIDWTLDFWNDKRKAIPTKNPNKCKKCEYFEKCVTSMIENE